MAHSATHEAEHAHDHDHGNGGSCCGSKLDPDKLGHVLEAVDRFRGMRGALIPVLHEVQETFGYLPEPVLQIVSDELQMPMAEIYGVASFYSFFSLEPKGDHVIRVCLGTACYIKGSQSLIDKLGSELRIPVGSTTDDGKFSLEATRCLGACGLAPVFTVGEKVYGRIGAKDVSRILKDYKDRG